MFIIFSPDAVCLIFLPRTNVLINQKMERDGGITPDSFLGLITMEGQHFSFVQLAFVTSYAVIGPKVTMQSWIAGT